MAGNLRGTSRDDVSGTFDATYSLIGDKGTATVNNIVGSQIGTTGTPINALLAALANYGGPTMTHALLLSSPAMDSGNPSALAGSGGVPSFDQRGNPFTRVFDGNNVGGARIDIGAFETGPGLVGDYNRNGVVDAADYPVYRAQLTAGVSVAPYTGADGNASGTVTTVDYLIWRNNFGNTIGGAGSGVAAVPGDYDGDGTVDDADFDLWLSTFGSTTNLAADGDDDGDVDQNDYGIWSQHYGNTLQLLDVGV